MKRLRRWLQPLWKIVVILLMFLGIVWIIDYTSELLTFRRVYQAGFALWQTAPMGHYRILINDLCEAEVINEQIVNTIRGACAATISDLFKRMDASLTLHWQDGTDCTLMVPYMAFDPVGGFPTRLEFHQEAPSIFNMGLGDYFLSQRYRTHNEVLCTAPQNNYDPEDIKVIKLN
jgi:hypothetical protein